METLLGVVNVVRSLRHQLQLPSSMLFTGNTSISFNNIWVFLSESPFFSHEGLLRSDDISENFPCLLTILTDIANLELSEVAPLAYVVPQGFMTCPIPGTTARLSLKIQVETDIPFLKGMSNTNIYHLRNPTVLNSFVVWKGWKWNLRSGESNFLEKLRNMKQSCPEIRRKERWEGFV